MEERDEESSTMLLIVASLWVAHWWAWSGRWLVTWSWGEGGVGQHMPEKGALGSRMDVWLGFSSGMAGKPNLP